MTAVLTMCWAECWGGLAAANCSASVSLVSIYCVSIHRASATRKSATQRSAICAESNTEFATVLVPVLCKLVCHQSVVSEIVRDVSGG